MDPWMPDRLLQDIRLMVMRSRMAMEARAATRMLSGVTGSDPFSDRRVIEFCLSLPADQFKRAGIGRRLARVAFADRLPPEITGNTRRGAQNVEWFRRLAPHRDRFVADLEQMESSPLASRLLDLPRLRRALAELPDNEEEAYRGNWLRRHNFLRGIHIARYLAWIDPSNG
jgi:asparagine synthase (glutamine-hydrolysing)